MCKKAEYQKDQYQCEVIKNVNLPTVELHKMSSARTYAQEVEYADTFGDGIPHWMKI